MDIKDRDIRFFQETIRDNSCYDFNDYSINSLKRRLIKVLGEYDSDMTLLTNSMIRDEKVLEEIVKKITVNTTELFRDPNVWQSILLKLLPRYRKHSSLHIWHPGCSTGQEVYSMMIVLDQLGLLEKSNIYASDINSDVLVHAQKGAYRLSFNREYIDNFNKVFSMDMNGNSEPGYHPWKKYFSIDEGNDKIQMANFLTKKPLYTKIDLVKDDNLFFVNFDLILCRNVIIYFNYELQNKVLSFFHRNLQSNGCLVLGLHESIIGPGTDLFNKDNQFFFKRNPE